MSRFRKKLLEWINRYGPAEVVGTITAIFGATIAHKLTSNEVVSAYSGSICESFGFYSIMLTQEFRRYSKGHHWQTARNLFLEFGPSEMLDSFVTRPLFMGLGLHYIGQGWGLIVGKLTADFIFYIPSIIIYEVIKIRKK